MVRYYSPDNLPAASLGDLIEFRRRLLFIVTYYHFAVCTVDSVADCRATVQAGRAVGDRITVGVDSPRYFVLTRIVEKTIRILCDGNGCRVNNLEEAARAKGLRPFEPDVIVERAREILGEDRLMFYNVATRNCEHFATYCRYGQAFSLQVSDFSTAAFTFISTRISAIRHVYFSRRRTEVDVLGPTIDEVVQNEASF